MADSLFILFRDFYSAQCTSSFYSPNRIRDPSVHGWMWHSTHKTSFEKENKGLCRFKCVHIAFFDCFGLVHFLLAKNHYVLLLNPLGENKRMTRVRMRMSLCVCSVYCIVWWHAYEKESYYFRRCTYGDESKQIKILGGCHNSKIEKY